MLLSQLCLWDDPRVETEIGSNAVLPSLIKLTLALMIAPRPGLNHRGSGGWCLSKKNTYVGSFIIVLLHSAPVATLPLGLCGEENVWIDSFLSRLPHILTKPVCYWLPWTAMDSHINSLLRLFQWTRVHEVTWYLTGIGPVTCQVKARAKTWQSEAWRWGLLHYRQVSWPWFEHFPLCHSAIFKTEYV